MEQVKFNELLTRKEVAKILRISYPTLHRWEDQKILKSIKIGGVRRYKLIDIQNLFNDNNNKIC